MLDPNNLLTLSFETCCGNSDGKPVKGTEQKHMLLFNRTQISVKEVDALIESGEWRYDSRVIEVTEKQVEYLKDKE